MLRSLRLENFRRFSDHEVPFEELTLLVGANNAGKSTAIEALRLISLVSNRLAGLHFRPPPDWLPSQLGSWGVAPSLRGFEFRLARHIFHRYGEPPSRLEARFDNGSAVTAFVGPDEEVFGVIRDPDGEIVRSKRDLRGWTLSRLGVQPQVAPLEPDELLLKEKTVRAGLNSSLSPRHFRNQLVLMSDLIDEFRRLAEETWPGLQIRELEYLQAGEGKPLTLMVRVDDFVGEIGVMGHGLQMWLQLIWFLVRARHDQIVVLDEPDVFMHPDLQRRLIRYLRRRRQQVVVATHSVEMLADVEPDQVVALQPGRRAGRRSRSLADVQQIVEQIGGVHNLELARLQRSQRFLFVEGKDLTLLDRIHAQQHPESLEPLSQIPHGSANGWTGWPQVIGAARLLRDQFGADFRVYAIFDLDYRWPEAVKKRREEAKREGIDLHIWSRKEVENYLLIPGLIARVVRSRAGKGPNHDEARTEIKRLAQGLRDHVIDALMDELTHRKPGLNASTARRQAREHMDRTWDSFDGKVTQVPGKQLVSKLSDWASRHYGASFGSSALAAALEPNEVAREMREVLDAIAANQSLSSVK